MHAVSLGSWVLSSVLGLEPRGRRNFPSARLYGANMPKPNKVVPKKARDRPAARHDPVTAVRLATELKDKLDAWAAQQPDQPGRSEAIRRLVELGLTVKMSAKQPSSSKAARAKELATKTIEKIIDPSAPPEERAQRRQRLTKGPLEFREARIDLPKAKGK
jgi:hypothetical protein